MMSKTSSEINTDTNPKYAEFASRNASMGIVGWFGKIATGRCYSFHQNHEREDLQ
jgi:hypothetical protein